MNHNNLIQVNYLNVRKPFGLKFQRVSLSKCFLCLHGVQSYKSTFRSNFNLNGRHLQSWFLPDMMWERTWGGPKSIAPKMDFWAFCARTKLLRHSWCTYKTFVFDRFSRLFIFTSKNASVDIGLGPPPPHLRFWQVCLGTITQRCPPTLGFSAGLSWHAHAWKLKWNFWP